MRAKLCGMRTREAAQAAERSGAAFVGFVFWPKSRRAVTAERAAEIAASLGAVKKVGVFVDAPLAAVNETARRCGLDFVQLHGHEDAAYARGVCVPVIKAYRFGASFDTRAAAAFPAAFVLLDSGAGGLPGGTGRRFAWREAAAALEAAPELKKRLFIAGGVARENLRELWEIFSPYGVDVSGSLEERGEKSCAKIEAFMQELRALNEEAGSKAVGQ